MSARKCRRSSKLFLEETQEPSASTDLALPLRPSEHLQLLELANDRGNRRLEAPPGNGGAHHTWQTGPTLEEAEMQSAIYASIKMAASNGVTCAPIKVDVESDADQEPDVEMEGSSMLRMCARLAPEKRFEYIDRHDSWQGAPISKVALLRTETAMDLVAQELAANRSVAISNGYQADCRKLI